MRFKESGQSLVEALIAIAIISGALFYLLKMKDQGERNLSKVSLAIDIQNDLLSVNKQVRALTKLESLIYLQGLNDFKFFEKLGHEKLTWLKSWQQEGKRPTYIFVTYEAFDEKGAPVHSIPKTPEEISKLVLNYKVELVTEGNSSFSNGTLR